MRTTATAPTDCWGSFLSEAPAVSALSGPSRDRGRAPSGALGSGAYPRPCSAVRPYHGLAERIDAPFHMPAHFLALLRRRARPHGPAAFDHIFAVIGLRSELKVMWVAAFGRIARVPDNQSSRGLAVMQRIGSSVSRESRISAVHLPMPKSVTAAGGACPKPAMATGLPSRSGRKPSLQFHGDIGPKQPQSSRRAFTRGARRPILRLGHRSLQSFGDKSARGVQALRVGAVIARAAHRAKQHAVAVASSIHAEGA